MAATIYTATLADIGLSPNSNAVVQFVPNPDVIQTEVGRAIVPTRPRVIATGPEARFTVPLFDGRYTVTVEFEVTTSSGVKTSTTKQFETEVPNGNWLVKADDVTPEIDASPEIDGSGEVGELHTGIFATWSTHFDERRHQWWLSGEVFQEGTQTLDGGFTTSEFTPPPGTERREMRYREQVRRRGGNWSAWSRSAGLQIRPAAAPALSDLTASATGSDSITATVTTNEGYGQLYILATEAAAADKSAIRTNGVASAVTVAGVLSASITGLPQGAARYVHVLQVDATGKESDVLTSGLVTTWAVPDAFPAEAWSVEAINEVADQVTLTIENFPAANGSPLSAIWAQVGGAAPEALSEAPTAGEAYTLAVAAAQPTPITIWAVNALGEGVPATKDAAPWMDYTIQTAADLGPIYVGEDYEIADARGTRPVGTDSTGAALRFELLMMQVAGPDRAEGVAQAGQTVNALYRVITSSGYSEQIVSGAVDVTDGPAVEITQDAAPTLAAAYAGREAITAYANGSTGRYSATQDGAGVSINGIAAQMRVDGEPVADDYVLSEGESLTVAETVTADGVSETFESAPVTVQPASAATTSIADFSRDMSTFDGGMPLSVDRRSRASRDSNYHAAPDHPTRGYTPSTVINAETADGIDGMSLRPDGFTVHVNGEWPSGKVVVGSDVVLRFMAGSSGEVSYYHDLTGTPIRGAHNALHILSGSNVTLGDIRIIGPDDVLAVDYGVNIAEESLSQWNSLSVEGFGSDPLRLRRLNAGSRPTYTRLRAGATLGRDARMYRYSGNPQDYVKDDYIWRDPGKPQGNADWIYKALVDNPTADPEYGVTTDNWKAIRETPHLDLLTIVEVEDDPNNLPVLEYFDLSWPWPEKWDGSAYAGYNNVIRLEPDTGNDAEFGALILRHGQLRGSPNNPFGGSNAGPVLWENTTLTMVPGGAIRYSLSNPNGTPPHVLDQTSDMRFGDQSVPRSTILAQDHITETISDVSGAEVRRSGTTGAADGAVMEARILDGTTDEVLYGWRDIGSAVGGLWSGSYLVPVTLSRWMRMQVRVQGASETATTANRFGVGLVVAQEDQSNVGQGLKDNLEPLEPPVIGNEAGDFQIIYPDSYRGAWTGGNSGFVSLHDGNPGTASMATMAQTFAQIAPGLKVVYAPLVLGGSHMADMLNDDYTDRPATEVSNAEGTGVIDLVTADGSEIGLFDYTRDADSDLIATYCLGTDRDGNVVAPSQTDAFPAQSVNGSRTITRVMSSLIPGLLSGRTKIGMFQCHPLSYIGPNSDVNLTNVPDFYADRADLSNYVRGIATFAEPIHSGMTQKPESPVDVNIHFNGSYRTGMPYKWAGMARAYSNLAGLIHGGSPQFDRFEAAPDGSKVTVWSSAGPITTKVRHDDGDAAQNFPVNPSVDRSVKRESNVLGFLGVDSNGEIVELVAKIVDADGNPATEGRLDLFPPEGETWSFTSQARYMPSGSHPVLRTDPFDVRDWITPDEVWSWHMPVVKDPDFPNSPFGGTVMPPSESPTWLTNRLVEAYQVAGVGVDPQVNIESRPIYKVSAGYDNKGSLTWEIRLVPSPVGDGVALSAIGNNYDANGGLALYSDGLNIANRSQGDDLYVGQIWDHGASGIDIYGHDTRLLIEMDGAAEEVRVYHAPGGSGSYTRVNTVTGTGNRSQLSGAVEWLPPQDIYDVYRSTFNGKWMFGRLWVDPSTQDGTPPADVVDYGLEETDGAGTPTLGGGSLEFLQNYQRPSD